MRRLLAWAALACIVTAAGLGSLITAGVAGWGEGEGKVTFALKDLTTGSIEIDQTIYTDHSPELVGDLLSRGNPLEKRATEHPLHNNWHTFHMNAGHVYEATVKLWTECATYGAYSIRTDFSRGTIGSSDNPLIGMVLVEKLTFDFRGARHGSGEGFE